MFALKFVPAKGMPVRTSITNRICLLLTLVTFAEAFVSFAVAQADEVDYNRDIRPILADKCFLCHGPDQGTRQADLRLDNADAAYAALASTPGKHAILPGDPLQSDVFLRISTTDPGLVMPPPDSNLSLTADQIKLIENWIRGGAVYQPIWSIIPPQKGPIPDVDHSGWVRNELDAFILKKMKEKNLTPNPPATREQLLRRVTFDLTGLPPTLEEIDAFRADDSPEAYERVVDRLLASEAYGERMAAEWLDVARYSDTYGFQVDKERFVWPWRDWVIRTFNQDLPYDQFLTQQLAGDLLPNATADQILATTFNRLHPQEAEGGSIPEEYRIGHVSDRVQTFATAFLGLTLECCKCHDHKYDPVTQQEYFQLASFFDNIDEAGLYSYFTNSVPTPTLLLADDASFKTIRDQESTVRRLEEQLQQVRSTRSEAMDAWLNSKPTCPEKLSGELLHLDFESVNQPNQLVDGKFGKAAQLTGDDVIGTNVGNFTRYSPFSVSLWINSPEVNERMVVFHRSQAWTDAGSRGYELLLEDGKLSAALIHFDPGNSIRVRSLAPLSIQEWHHVAITYDGSSKASGIQIYVDGKAVGTEVIRDALTKEITGGGGDNISIGERMRDKGFKNGKVDEFRVFSRTLTPIEVAHLFDQTSLKSAFEAEFTGKIQDHPLWDYYLSVHDGESLAAVAALHQARKEAVEYIEPIQEIMVMRETPEERQTYLLTRGEYNLPADPVESDTPAVLLPFPEHASKNRLGLAQWMCDPQHPLTSRVAVNRYWQMIFGAGLVRTTEDFGVQGEWPTHPELFDWLSRDFIDEGWSLKKLIKKMVMSSTYQQSAFTSAEKMAIDPANQWLSRATSERLTAEMLRDNALAVSGLLVKKIGGPPARPYEMEVAFKPLAKDQGEGLYRRSLYTYWSRTGPAPVMMTLDAAKRDVCQVRRERTLSPLQPLVLLNGPQFVEAARMLAERAMKAHPDHPEAIITDMYRLATSRAPKTEELSVLMELYQQHLEDFTAHPEQATAFLAVGDHPRDTNLNPTELAAFGGVANLLLNIDDCVFRR
ncbi:DUF1553 domain-containing protein [Planctomicrobium sp. SH668]|uniref:DUF1553 domain-containing protein n=1 Tax=Planctomicrobium sp. SH668 TaxID=3448126 RepID=UPI003F5C30CF